VTKEWVWDIDAIILTGKITNNSEKDVCRCHLVQHKSHIGYPGIEMGPLWWETAFNVPEPWHGRGRRLKAFLDDWGCSGMRGYLTGCWIMVYLLLLLMMMMMMVMMTHIFRFNCIKLCLMRNHVTADFNSLCTKYWVVQADRWHIAVIVSVHHKRFCNLLFQI
jgi:hypothetical protein